MPLMHGKSDKAFQHNVRTEMHHDKPLNQSLAIAYALKRRAQKAYGGEVKCEEHGLDMCPDCVPHAGGEEHAADLAHEQYAEGGDVKKDPMAQLAESVKKAFGALGEGHEEKAGAEEKHESNPVSEGMKKAFKSPGYADGGMVDDIMRKKYSKGGQVANDTDDNLADFSPNEFDDLVLRDDLEQHYTGANSGDEIGNEQEEQDQKDMISMIMKSRKKKDKLPHPA